MNKKKLQIIGSIGVIIFGTIIYFTLFNPNYIPNLWDNVTSGRAQMTPAIYKGGAPFKN